jgi:hypothetical protein
MKASLRPNGLPPVHERTPESRILAINLSDAPQRFDF